MVDLEVDANAAQHLTCANNMARRTTHLNSTPSLIVTGFFLRLAISFWSSKFMTSCLPGGSVGEASSR